MSYNINYEKRESLLSQFDEFIRVKIRLQTYFCDGLRKIYLTQNKYVYIYKII